jgi:hypothetical protein
LMAHRDGVNRNGKPMIRLTISTPYRRLHLPKRPYAR